ncbi:hypothetical protein GN244_ATG11902 [Phytophthora infestans]|uniref:Uncharacterized protein n=1 Tax=Phytophthora infestans TaxID=4787 RepID=A0A833T118_PHYIN|nr:hypothetical protein GN244_ATG11902 [Phytophthora infestans]
MAGANCVNSHMLYVDGKESPLREASTTSNEKLVDRGATFRLGSWYGNCLAKSSKDSVRPEGPLSCFKCCFCCSNWSKDEEELMDSSFDMDASSSAWSSGGANPFVDTSLSSEAPTLLLSAWRAVARPRVAHGRHQMNGTGTCN